MFSERGVVGSPQEVFIGFVAVFLVSADLGDIPAIGAQDLSNILKQGYLEKKRKGITEHVLSPHPYYASSLLNSCFEMFSSHPSSDHSFFGSEWQKRWCVLNNTVFYYFGSEKDKQQKGSFYIGDYSVQMVNNLRKDSKKNACFEFTAPGRRAFQLTGN
ncbi:Src kinase-associated phosphoprotein 1 [Xenoophorus captivus]|uniref:Src kinase-associated phosphoprotein 1 n=1 Tax=Xenoophorus captivus TaxID=1517983 RepID=A0ABV0QP54_9TELE